MQRTAKGRARSRLSEISSPQSKQSPYHSRVEPAQRRVDAGERLRFHLDQREVDAVLKSSVGVIAIVQHLLGAIRAAVAHTRPDLALDRATAFHQNLAQVTIASLGRRIGRHLFSSRRASWRRRANRALPL